MTYAERIPPDTVPSAVTGLSIADLARLRRLAQRYRVRDDGTIRPVADVTFELRLWHRVRLSVQDVHWLLTQEDSR